MLNEFLTSNQLLMESEQSSHFMLDRTDQQLKCENTTWPPPSRCRKLTDLLHTALSVYRWIEEYAQFCFWTSAIIFPLLWLFETWVHRNIYLCSYVYFAHSISGCIQYNTWMTEWSKFRILTSRMSISTIGLSGLDGVEQLMVASRKIQGWKSPNWATSIVLCVWQPNWNRKTVQLGQILSVFGL